MADALVQIQPRAPKPPWLKVRLAMGPNYQELKGIMRGLSLHSVCEEAHCPNIGECWENRTATFMILGDICTRACRYCAVTSGKPLGLDLREPVRVAEAVVQMGLRHAVITSVNRDDLPDGGAGIFAETIRQIRKRDSAIGIEVLIPDFRGNWDALALVMDAKPNILNHNTETVPRLYPKVRHRGIYEQTLELLERAKLMDPSILTKSGVIVGMGERWDELLETLADLRACNVDIITIGQYLRPTMKHLVLDRYYTPQEFAELKAYGMSLGFKHVESGPLVRSSYHAHSQVQAAVGSTACG
jgi:lipoic acid synthetase